MPKPIESSFRLWKRSIPRLRRTFKTLDGIRAKLQDDDIAAQLALIDYDLKANREVRETLQTEMRVRREIVELRKLELDGMTNDEVEALLVKTAQRRGYRHIEGIRDGLREFLTPSLGPDLAAAVVDAAVPSPHTERPCKRLTRSIGQVYDSLQRDLDEGARDIQECLEPRHSDDSVGPIGDTQETPQRETRD